MFFIQQYSQNGYISKQNKKSQNALSTFQYHAVLIFVLRDRDRTTNY